MSNVELFFISVSFQIDACDVFVSFSLEQKEIFNDTWN